LLLGGAVVLSIVWLFPSEADYYRVWECNGMDSEIQVKSPSALKNTEKIYPWTLLEKVVRN
jgi:hypothetical protein